MTSVADPTDPGTRRPVEPPIPQSGANFQAVSRPLRAPKVTCPEASDAYSLFALFFSDRQLQIIANNTNKNAKKQLQNVQEKRGGGRDLGDLFTRE